MAYTVLYPRRQNSSHTIKFEKQYYCDRCQKGNKKKNIIAGWVHRISKFLQIIRTVVYKGKKKLKQALFI
jgi:hypothetical protein